MHVEVVVGVGGLEPGTAVVEIEVDGVSRSERVVDAIEDVLLVAAIMKDGELGRIEEAARVEAVNFNEVAPTFASVGEIDCAGGGTEGAIGGADAAGGLGDSLS